MMSMEQNSRVKFNALSSLKKEIPQNHKSYDKLQNFKLFLFKNIIFITDLQRHTLLLDEVYFQVQKVRLHFPCTFKVI